MSDRTRSGLAVLPGLVIAEDELRFDAIRAGGPGGQNVNKVATAVVFHFALSRSRSLTEEQRARVRERLGGRLDSEGDIVVRVSTHRHQGRNVEEARRRLAELLADALTPERPRFATRPTRGSRQRRLRAKRHLSERKRARRSDGGD